jgi:heme/copper-type cytochrome/quinol oxidase subunit 2
MDRRTDRRSRALAVLDDLLMLAMAIAVAAVALVAVLVAIYLWTLRRDEEEEETRAQGPEARVDDDAGGDDAGVG